MAAKKQKGKRAGGRAARGTANKRKEAEIPFLSEVVLLVILALCILLFLSNFGLGGSVGAKVSGVCFGIFGLAAYLVPICIFVGAAFYTSNRKNRMAAVKLVAAGLFVAFLCLFIELAVAGNTEEKLLASYTYGASNKNGGGIVGGALSRLLCSAFGLIGSYVVDIIILIISLVLITERSFFGGVKKGSKKVYHTAKEDAVRYREHAVKKKEERMQRRLDRRVEGVAADTKIVPPSLESSDNLSELKPVKQMPQFTKQAMEKLFYEERTQAQEVEPVYVKRGQGESRGKVSAGTGVLSFRSKASSEGTKAASAGTGAVVSRVEPAVVSTEPVVSRVEPSAVSTEPVNIVRESVYPETELLLTKGEPMFSRLEKGISSRESFTVVEKDLPVQEEAGGQASPAIEEQYMEAVPLSQKPKSPNEQELAIKRESSEEQESVTEWEASNEQRPIVKKEPAQEQGFGVRVEPSVTERVQRRPNPEKSSPLAEREEEEESREKEYLFPPTDLLKPGSPAVGNDRHHLQETALKLQQILKNFGVNVTITDVSCGPSVTRYELQPELGVKVSKIVNLSDDIKLNLAAPDIRIEAPIPGKAAVGIEVPNKETVMVRFRDMVEAPEFKNHSSSICFTAGKDIAGQVVVADIAKMPHLLIAGATGSGKSVCINTIIMSILYKANPEDVKLILIDPKVVELSVYNGIPHLFIPVVTDPKKAAGALHWAVAEMTERYQKFAEYQVRDLKSYNQKVAAISDIEDETKPEKLPQIVIVVDELADLMMVAAGDVEDAICRLAQLARAAGIHMIIATQRPSVDVITGLIKANMPSRIAFSVSSGVDSRTILDMNGAEKLLGNGDMLFYPQGIQKPLRVQGPFVSDTEVEAVVNFLKKQNDVTYNTEIEEKMNTASSQGAGPGGGERDAYFVDAGKFVIEKDKGSIGMLQRWFKIGFNRAARIMDQLEEAGVVGPEEGTKPRKILMSMEEFENYVEEYV